MRFLADAQTAAFDVEYVQSDRWQSVHRRLDEHFPDGAFRFLDVGGGNGRFTDRILRHYPSSHGTLVDCSRPLLAKNVLHPRKRMVYGTANEIAELFAGAEFDVVFFNWLLHHLVGDSYAETWANMVDALTAARRVLSQQGCLSIFEDLYDGRYIDWLPSHLVFHLTSSRTIAPVARRLGANTAGVGVCFLSHRRWRRVFDTAGLRVAAYEDDPAPRVNGYRRWLLHLGDDRVGHFWCRPLQTAIAAEVMA